VDHEGKLDFLQNINDALFVDEFDVNVGRTETEECLIFEYFPESSDKN